MLGIGKKKRFSIAGGEKKKKRSPPCLKRQKLERKRKGGEEQQGSQNFGPRKPFLRFTSQGEKVRNARPASARWGKKKKGKGK